MAAAETVVPANRMREEEDLMNNDFIDLMNPRDDRQIGSTDKKEEILPSYDFQPILPIGSSSPPSKFETGGAGGPRAWNSTDNNSSSPSIRAFVVENYRRPLPKVKSTTQDSSRYEASPAPPGSLNVSQLQYIMHLYQGKADDHRGPMAIPEIAKLFHIDAEEVKRILRFVSLPPEDETKTRLKEKPTSIKFSAAYSCSNSRTYR